jgi:hypothetical protein
MCTCHQVCAHLFSYYRFSNVVCLYRQGVEAIRAKSARLQRQREPLAKWFADHAL